MDRDIEQAADKAAGDPVPAEAIEAGAEASYNYHVFHVDPDPDAPRWGFAEEVMRDAWRDHARVILAAAAPLIVADREETIKRLKGAMKALDNGLAQHGEHIERLTAERDAAEAQIAAALSLLNPSVQSFSRETILKARAALAGGDPPRGED